MMYIYSAITFTDQQLKTIEGGHKETFESNYPIAKGDEIKFGKIFGSFKVINVSHDIRTGIIGLLCSPDVRYSF